MKRVHTSLAILAAAAFSLAACGSDDGGDDPDTTDATEETTASDDTAPTDDTGEQSSDAVPDEVREILPDITEEQYECVNDAGADLSGGDVAEAMDVLEECGIDLSDMQMPDLSMPDISMPDLSIPDISMPDISLTDDPADMIAQMFPNLTDDQASCLAEQGADIDPSNVGNSMEIFEECDIELSDLTGG